MRAVVLERTGGPEELGVRELDDPVPGPEDVLVRVGAAGVCGRDLIDRRGGFPAMKLPAILGHELAGVVEAVGERVTHVAVGDRVANLHRPFCGQCRACLAGNAVDCERAWQSFGHTVDGAYAELCVAHERALVKIPSGVSFVDAASVGCTAGVALRALRREAALELGETVLITGASGGVGLMAIQIAKRAGARVIAVTSSPEKVSAIERFGADRVIVAPDGTFDAQDADVALELVGSSTFTSALKSLRRAGRLVLVGNITLGRVSVNPGALILFGLRILGSHGYSVRDLEDCFALMERGELTPAIDRTLPLEGAADAHRLLAERKVTGRIVLVPNERSV